MKQLQLLSIAVLSVCAASAFADDSTTTFLVTAEVSPTCVLSVPTLAFGTYDPVDETATTGSTVLTATCVDGAGYSIALNAGVNAGTPGDVTTRQMIGGASGDLLGYGLYQDALFDMVWGDTDGGLDGNTVIGTGTGMPITYTIYGQIPPGQTTITDDSDGYSDTITVDVTL